MQITTKNSEETIRLGEKIGEKASSGMIIALYGDLGAGKTTLVQGIAKGLGINDYVTSPSFIIISEYKGRIDLTHIDLYRLDDKLQIEDIGIDDQFMKDNNVCVIEWAEKLGDLLPKGAVKINIDNLSENERKISVEGLDIK